MGRRSCTRGEMVKRVRLQSWPSDSKSSLVLRRPDLSAWVGDPPDDVYRWQEGGPPTRFGERASWRRRGEGSRVEAINRRRRLRSITPLTSDQGLRRHFPTCDEIGFLVSFRLDFVIPRGSGEFESRSAGYWNSAAPGAAELRPVTETGTQERLVSLSSAGLR